MMASDLHIHTTASDGKLTPEAVVAEAKAAGLSYIAITDHDTVGALFLLEERGLLQDRDLHIIPGVEFSIDLADREVHILGYGIEFHHAVLLERLNFLSMSRRGRFDRMIEKVQALGYDMKRDEVLALVGAQGSLGRPHIARALVEKGYFKKVSDVFDALLEKGRPGYEPHAKLTYPEVLDLIRSAGGKSILAHPGMIGDDQIVAEIISAGINGLEVYHPKHDNVMRDRYKKMAEQHGLLVTGGSDYHAIKSRYPEQLGLFTVDDVLAIAILS